MSLESLYKLSILVNMIDRVSAPAARISTAVGGTMSKFEAYSTGIANMARDGTVLMGTGYQIANAAMSPVKATFATKDAIGELSSLGIEKLGALEDAATDFTNTWAGTTKAEFLTAAYDIKSGIASLSDEGVAEYTKLSGMTAKATKSTIAEMTSLFATGYSIYKDYYGDLTDIGFGEIFSSGIAQSVKQFKTTGSGMAQAISALGGTATSANVPLEEQLSILGMLQATMSGSEAGTKYTAFLQSAARAGGELGLKFTDANGQLRSMPEILGSIKGKFGDVLTAADKLELQKAFGTVEAVKLIDLLYGKTSDLQSNIITLYDTMGMGTSITKEMANKINAPPGQSWIALKQQMQSALETVGNAMLPTFTKMQTQLDGVANKVSEFANKYPQLTSAIAYTIGAFGMFLIVVGVLKFAIGLLGSGFLGCKKILQGFSLVVKSVKYGLFLVQFAAYNAKTALAPLGAGFLKLAGNVKTALIGMMAWVKQGILSAVAALPGLIASVWGFTAALLANPITWIVLGIVALIAAIILLWKNWDSVTAWLKNTWDAVCGGIAAGIQWVRDLFGNMPGWVKVALAVFFPFIGIPMLIIENWDKIKTFFANLPETIKQGFGNLKTWFADFFGGLWSFFFDSGKKMITTFVDGIKAVAMNPVNAVKGAFTKLRELLPFSDAKTGPLSDLTLSGKRVFTTFVDGMQQTADLPSDTTYDAFFGMDSGVDMSGTSGTGVPAQGNTITIKKLIINADFKDMDDFRKLKKLIEEIEDGCNSSPDTSPKEDDKP